MKLTEKEFDKLYKFVKSEGVKNDVSLYGTKGRKFITFTNDFNERISIEIDEICKNGSVIERSFLVKKTKTIQGSL